MNPLPRRLGLALILVAGLSHDSRGRDEKPVGAWCPDAAALKDLGPEEDAWDYGLRLPGDHRPIGARGVTEDQHLLIWGIPDRTEPINPNLILGSVDIPQGGAPEAAEAFLEGYKAAVAKSYKEGLRKALKLKKWKEAPLERGTIVGIPFTRMHWEAESGVTTGKLRGFFYVGRDRDKIITLNSFDADEAVLKRREAAVLTFRRL